MIVYTLHGPRCQWCNHKLALELEGRLVMYCPKCKKPNTIDTRDLTADTQGSTMQAVKQEVG